MPAIRPPPPTGTKIASIGRVVLAQDLHADRALAGDHVGIVVRMDEGEPASPLELARVRVGVVVGVAVQHDLRAARATASTLIRGVVIGITITARQPSFCAASATPCAWLPAEAAITPRFSASRGQVAILL